MDIRRVVALAGPNIWTNYKALEAWVDIGRFEDFPSNQLPGFSDRIMTWLPSMVEHRCGIGERGGFFQRLTTGTYLGHILEHVTIELQSLAGVPVEFGRARETSERGVYKVVVEFTEEQFARAALQTARSLILAAVDNTAFDVSDEIKKLRSLANALCLGPGSRSIITAAAERHIPHLRLNNGSLVQLGYCNAQRRIWAAETDGTSAVAESIAQDKQLTRQLLEAVGISVPKGRVVSSRDDAWEAAQEIGLPIVVKPRDGNYGRGVSIDLQDEESIKSAYDWAECEGSGVVAERMIHGFQHRVLVVNGKAIAACRGDAEHVVGDGVHNIVELVKSANDQPLRGSNHDCPLSTLVLDEIALGLLRRQGFSPDSVPTEGHQVVIHYNGDMTEDVTDDVHADVAGDCILAAQTVGLNIAGIDLIANRIDQPLNVQGGAILEVNASPGLLMHLHPLQGKPRPVGAAVVSALFPANETGRVPIVAVTGTNGKTSAVGLLDHILTCAGKNVGVTSSDGISVCGRRIASGDCANAPSASRILINPFVNAAVFEVSASSVLNEGLAFDQCDVAIVTNLGSGDHMGAQYVETLEVITKAKRAPVDVVAPHGVAVLNADDSAVAGLSTYCPGDTVFFSRSIEVPTVAGLLGAGKRVVTIDDGSIVLAQNDATVSVVPVSAIPHSCRGQLAFAVENALAAIGAAWALGIGPSHIAEGLARAEQCVSSSFCCFVLDGATIVLSQCRNVSALNATISALGVIGNPVEQFAVFGVHPDQRLNDAFDQGLLLAQYFDRVVVGGYFDSATDALRLLISELERGATSAGRAREIRQATHNLVDIGHLSQAVKGLKAQQMLLFQVGDSSHMLAARQYLLELGASLLAQGPNENNPATASARESNHRLYSSNHV
jgi:cyanophycin synthetase